MTCKEAEPFSDIPELRGFLFMCFINRVHKLQIVQVNTRVSESNTLSPEEKAKEK